MNLKNLTDEDLAAWRASPMTELLKACVERSLEVQKAVALDSYWAGNPWPPEQLAALKRSQAQFEDFFESSAEDLRVVMEQIDDYEQERNTAA